MKLLTLLVASLGFALPPVASQAPARPGILLLAHGGSAAWNEHVAAIAARVNATIPTETALGMASRGAIQAATDKLLARGVTEIRAVPLFVSSHSSVITSTEYLLGVRATAPPEVAIFARMSHGGGGHEAHAAPEAVDPLARVSLTVPVRMTRALDAHEIVSAILVDRAKEISRDPAAESIVLVAHGPVADDENRRWLDDLAAHAGRVQKAAPYASVDALTVRDDAPKPIRDAASEELRALVSRRIGEGRKVLIVPVLLSFGGIEKGIRTRLEGLTYTMPSRGLLPDDRLVDWILSSAKS
jgi:sirohydrochlorin cobaltochelatase